MNTTLWSKRTKRSKGGREEGREQRTDKEMRVERERENRVGKWEGITMTGNHGSLLHAIMFSRLEVAGNVYLRVSWLADSMIQCAHVLYPQNVLRIVEIS